MVVRLDRLARSLSHLLQVIETLEAKGARKQRPLWASTGVKNPEYPDTLYVDRLVADPVEVQ